jgi:hypothetical protein
LSTLQDFLSLWLSFTSFFSLLETFTNPPKICSGLDQDSFFSLPISVQMYNLQALGSLAQAEPISHELLLSISLFQCPFEYERDLLIAFVVKRRQGLIQVQTQQHWRCQLRSFGL